jgi:predicted pPIWI-associating nuclease
MAGRESDFASWEALWHRIDSFSATLGRNRAKNVNAAALRKQAREIVTGYFGEQRNALQRLGTSEEKLNDFDSEMQRLIGLSTGLNSRLSYQKTLRALKALRKRIETGLEFLIGRVENPATSLVIASQIEVSISKTLQHMLPNAAKSYEQVLVDLQDKSKKSYRGTAAELRESVREVLDHLAPDADVMASAGFKLEQGQNGPTMKQKMRFILRARKLGDAGRQTAEDSVAHLDENIAALGRSVYTRGSVDLHTGRERQEILNFKMYADAVLGELLGIHKPVEVVTDKQLKT